MQLSKKRLRLKIEWPANKSWVYDALESIVKHKLEMGMESNIQLEVARIVENYLTGTILGKKLDSEAMREIREEVLGTNTNRINDVRQH